MVETIARAVMAADWPMAQVSALAGAGPLLAETSEAEEPAVTPEDDPGHERPVLLNGLMPIDVEEEIVSANRTKHDDIEDRRRWNMLRWTGAWPEVYAAEGPYRGTFLSTEDGGWLHLQPYVAPVPSQEETAGRKELGGGAASTPLLRAVGESHTAPGGKQGGEDAKTSLPRAVDDSHTAPGGKQGGEDAKTSGEGVGEAAAEKAQAAGGGVEERGHEAVGVPMPKSHSPLGRERHVLTHIPYMLHGALCASRAEDMMIHIVPDDFTLDRSSCSSTTGNFRYKNPVTPG